MVSHLWPLKLLIGVRSIMEQEGGMRSHPIYDSMLINEADLSCIHSDLTPDLLEPENMKTYSFNYSGQLPLLKMTAALYFSQILQLVCVNNRGANTAV